MMSTLKDIINIITREEKNLKNEVHIYDILIKFMSINLILAPKPQIWKTCMSLKDYIYTNVKKGREFFLQKETTTINLFWKKKLEKPCLYFNFCSLSVCDFNLLLYSVLRLYLVLIWEIALLNSRSNIDIKHCCLLKHIFLSLLSKAP